MTLNDTIQVGKDTGLTEAEVRSAVDGSSVSVGEADTVDGQDASEFGGGPNVPAYEEDPNSPFEVTDETSLTATLANPQDYTLILADPRNIGFNRMQVNGITSNDYNSRRISDSIFTGEDRFRIGDARTRTRLVVTGEGFRLRFSANHATTDNIAPIGGEVDAGSGPLTQFTLSNKFGNPRSTRIRVFGLDV